MWTTEHTIETTAAPEAVWRAWTDVARWPEWNADIERIEMKGPFAVGSTIAMTPRREETVVLRVAEVIEGELFVDEADVAGTVVRTTHRIDRLNDRKTRIVYRLDATGPAAEAMGSAISADFDDTLAALTEYVAR
jgi:uncharacterized protein YndB with AHSA1/START domain